MADMKAGNVANNWGYRSTIKNKKKCWKLNMMEETRQEEEGEDQEAEQAHRGNEIFEVKYKAALKEERMY